VEDRAHDEINGGDIEAEIRKEIEGLRPGTPKTLFYSVRLDIPCGKHFSGYRSATYLTDGPHSGIYQGC
jgi:hypothetical protein